MDPAVDLIPNVKYYYMMYKLVGMIDLVKWLFSKPFRRGESSADSDLYKDMSEVEMLFHKLIKQLIDEGADNWYQLEPIPDLNLSTSKSTIYKAHNQLVFRNFAFIHNDSQIVIGADICSHYGVVVTPPKTKNGKGLLIPSTDLPVATRRMLGRSVQKFYNIKRAQRRAASKLKALDGVVNGYRLLEKKRAKAELQSAHALTNYNISTNTGYTTHYKYYNILTTDSNKSQQVLQGK